MKKAIFTLILAAIFGWNAYAQDDPETYTAYKVTGEMVPVIDGTIEPAWNSVEKVPLLKVPEIGGEVHPNITVPDPDPTDYYAEIGMCWNDDGIFFYFLVVDDKIVIEEDYYTDNEIEADQWWVDDNINILFSEDLYNQVFTQWEFAWQPGVDQEEKLSSDLWANPALIDGELVESAWYNDGNTWVLETFIDWFAFADDPTPGQPIFLEARARDDDDDGPWESMFQWSTINYNIETDGIGMGEVTLSETELAPTGVPVAAGGIEGLRIYPNPSMGLSDLEITLDRRSQVGVSVYDMSGKRLLEQLYGERAAGSNTLPLDLESLQKGVYLINVKTAERSSVVKFVRQ